MQSFTILSRKSHKISLKKISIVNKILKFIFNYKVFSTKLRSHELCGSREFITIFRVTPKRFSDPCFIWTKRWLDWLRLAATYRKAKVAARQLAARLKFVYCLRSVDRIPATTVFCKCWHLLKELWKRKR